MDHNTFDKEQVKDKEKIVTHKYIIDLIRFNLLLNSL